MDTFKIDGEFIHLNQLIKLMKWCENGGQSNLAIESGLVSVNGEIEYRKRNKIRAGDLVEFEDQKVKIE